MDVTPPPDAQLPRSQLRSASPEATTGLEPALPGTEPAAFDPIWQFLAARLPLGEPPELWLRLTAEILIPVLRENRLGVGEEPVWISLCRRAGPEAESGASVWSLDWWFNRQTEPERQCVQPPRQTYRLSVGTQTWPRLMLHVQRTSSPSASDRECVWAAWIRAGQGPQSLTGSHRAAERAAGRWTLGPPEPLRPEWEDFFDRR